jgi:hypothetical protein
MHCGCMLRAYPFRASASAARTALRVVRPCVPTRTTASDMFKCSHYLITIHLVFLPVGTGTAHVEWPPSFQSLSSPVCYAARSRLGLVVELVPTNSMLARWHVNDASRALVVRQW